MTIGIRLLLSYPRICQTSNPIQPLIPQFKFHYHVTPTYTRSSSQYLQAHNFNESLQFEKIHLHKICLVHLRLILAILRLELLSLGRQHPDLQSIPAPYYYHNDIANNTKSVIVQIDRRRACSVFPPMADLLLAVKPFYFSFSSFVYFKKML